MHPSKKIHFHSFDALRFFAFFKVFIFHLPLFAVGTELPFSSFYYNHVKHGGGIGVSFFFVLSGFLITYILTFEKIKSGKIDLKKFFIRRAFRIWPLFFLIVFIALLIPNDVAQSIGFHTNWGGYDPDYRFSLTFLENYKSIIMDNFPRTTPLSVFWSLCVEEHFYILWMIVFFFIKPKKIPLFLILSIVAAWCFRIFEYPIYQTEVISTNDLFTNLDYFAISGLLGYSVARNYQGISSKILSIPAWIRIAYIFIVLLVLMFQKQLFMHEIWFLRIFKFTIFATMFTLLIMVFIPIQSKIRISNNNIFTKLGKISYGLYVYHLIWIHVFIKIFRSYEIKFDDWFTYCGFVLIVFSGSVITSYLSYRYFETPFLKLRERYFSK